MNEDLTHAKKLVALLEDNLDKTLIFKVASGATLSGIVRSVENGSKNAAEWFITINIVSSENLRPGCLERIFGYPRMAVDICNIVEVREIPKVGSDPE